MASIDMQKMNLRFENQIKYFEVYKESNVIFNTEYDGIEVLKNLKYYPATISNIYVSLPCNIPCYTLQLKTDRNNKNDDIKSIKMVIEFDYESYKIFNSGYEPRSIYFYTNKENTISPGNPIILSPGYKYIVEISQSRHHYLGVRRSCRNEIFKYEIYDATLGKTKLLSGNYGDCTKIVYQKFNVERCKCYLNDQPIYKNESWLPMLCYNLTRFSFSEMNSNINCLKKIMNFKRYLTLIKDLCSKYINDKCDGQKPEIKSWAIFRRK